MLLRMSAFVDDDNAAESDGDSHERKNKRALTKHFLWTRHCSQCISSCTLVLTQDVCCYPQFRDEERAAQRLRNFPYDSGPASQDSKPRTMACQPEVGLRKGSSELWTQMWRN